MLKTMLMGNLTADPRAVSTNSGAQFVSFTVAHNERNRNGKNVPVFVECTAWRSRVDPATGKETGRDLGGTIMKHFHKGDPILVEGTPRASHYTNSDGTVVDKLCLSVNEFYFCGRAARAEQQTAEPAAEPQQMPMTHSPAAFTPVETDELPF